MIKVNNLSKKFKIYSRPWHRALEWSVVGQKRFHKEFWALRDVSFEVERGECLGVIGPNGAGKTTLLKILTRALYPTTGTFQIGGRVLSLLELGTGFNPELTGRRNLYMSADLLGLSDGYLKSRIKDIEAFAELGDFFDRPVKLYSSGMYVRLAFSLFAFLQPEVLIIDEALSVGDVFFQQKSFAKMREMISSGTTCLFVSHDTAAVQNLCERAILLRQGHIAFIGDAKETVSRYYAASGVRDRQIPKTASTPPTSPKRVSTMEEIMAHNILVGHPNHHHGAGGLEIVAATVTDSRGHHTMQVEMSQSLTFHLLLQANEEIVDPSAGIKLYDRLGNHVFAAGTRQLGYPLPALNPGERLIVALDLTMSVQPGEYTFGVGTSEPSEEGPNFGYAQDRIDMLGPLVVTYDPNKIFPFYGIAKLPMKARHCRIDTT
jgi:lipopolysaccharide transport system ATP-binding protein